MWVSLGQSHPQPPSSLGLLPGCPSLLLAPSALGSFCLVPEPHSPESPRAPHLVGSTRGTSWTKELESLQEGLGGICRGQGGVLLGWECWHISGAMPSRGEWVGERQSRATTRECQMLLGCELGSCESRSVQSHLERGDRRGGRGLFPRLNLVGFSYSRFRIWAANWCSFGTGWGRMSTEAAKAPSSPGIGEGGQHAGGCSPRAEQRGRHPALWAAAGRGEEGRRCLALSAGHPRPCNARADASNRVISRTARLWPLRVAAEISGFPGSAWSSDI